MQTLYIKSDFLEKLNAELIADIKAVLSTCVPLEIYCGIENEVWGIWLEVDKVKYLVDPIRLVDSIFEDGQYYNILERYHATENKYVTIDIHKDTHCYSWRYEGGISADPHQICFNFEEYPAKIKTVVEELYDAMKSGKPLAYKKPVDIEDLETTVAQMKISAVMPRYYKLMNSEVEEEPFVFEIEKDTYNEHYTIGIGDRQYTTWLTHWDNNYDTIRHQFESIAYNGEATIELTFDMSDTVLTIRRVSVMEDMNESDGGYGFSYKDYALVEIQPNEFLHGPILKGYCDWKQTIKTLYEGLLTLALNHPEESMIDDAPGQLEAYNMFKSPVIERYISGIKGSSQKAELRQVHVKRIIKIYPDYDEVLIDSVGGHIDLEGDDGNIDELYDKEGKPFTIPELGKWQEEIIPVVLEGAVGRDVPAFEWKDYHQRGLALAQQLRERLSSDFDLWYMAPVEDKSRIIPKPVLIYEQDKKEDEEEEEDDE